MKTLGRAGRASLIFPVGFGCGFLVGGLLAVANYSKDHRNRHHCCRPRLLVGGSLAVAN